MAENRGKREKDKITSGITNGNWCRPERRKLTLIGIEDTGAEGVEKAISRCQNGSPDRRASRNGLSRGNSRWWEEVTTAPRWAKASAGRSPILEGGIDSTARLRIILNGRAKSLWNAPRKSVPRWSTRLNILFFFMWDHRIIIEFRYTEIKYFSRHCAWHYSKWAIVN